MADQALALRLARELEACPTINYKDHAAELRRLSAVNAELAENLEKKSVAIQRIWKERDELRKVNAELLEALCALVLNIDAGGATLGAMKDARAAIARAEGEPK